MIQYYSGTKIWGTNIWGNSDLVNFAFIDICALEAISRVANVAIAVK